MDKVPLEPPTEPLASPVQLPVPPRAAGAGGGSSTPGALAAGPFSHTRYRFTTGLRAGHVAPIRDDDGRVLLSYRSFANVAGIVSTLVSAIVFVAGLAAVLFLLAEGAPIRAAMALALTMVFAFTIRLLVPRVNVTLYDEHNPALTVSQLAIFPTARYVIATPNGGTLAELRRSPLSRIGRNRWTIVQNGRHVGEAFEESLRGALVRKFLGKFSRRFETDVVIEHGGLQAARIVRRARPNDADVLDLTSDAMDRRILVAVATLVLGREP